MEIIFHAHHAEIPPALRRRAARVAEQAATRLRRAVDAVIRFEADGPECRAEILLHAPRQRTVVATGSGADFDAALTAASARLSAQLRRLKSLRTTKARGAVRA